MSDILSLFTFWFLSIGVISSPYASHAEPQTIRQAPSWIPRDHIVVGEWGPDKFHLSLQQNGEMTLRQSGLILRGEHEELNGTLKTIGQIHRGYWWLHHDKLCLSLQLNAQCMHFKVTNQKDKKVLALKLGQRWVRLKRLE